jgi:pilus assembly protein Flp/PilA
MKMWKRAINRRNEFGATAVEYGLLLALIAAVIIGAVAALGGPVMGLYERVDWWS